MKKTALVTGGAVRVGKAISLGLSEAGYDVVVIYNSSRKQAFELEKEIKSHSKNCDIIQCDISKTKNIEELFKYLNTKFKNISLIINNSSVFDKYSLNQTSEEIFDKHFNINLKAPFFITKLYSEYCKLNQITNGHIINILDSYINSNSTPYFAYLMTKKSLKDFTEMSAIELGPEIRVNAVSIGLLLNSKEWDDNKINEKVLQTPLKRRTNLKNITDAILYLDANDNLTGNNLFVDSGLSLKL